MTANKTGPVQATAPKRIYLQGGPLLHENIDFSSLSEVTWCRDDVDGTGIPYVRADLAGAAPAAVAPQCVRFFKAGTEGLEEHDTAEAAQAAAQEEIDIYRDEAADGWPEEVDSVCWGVILGKAVERPVKDAPFMAGILGSDMEPVDYVLEPVAAPALEAPAAPTVKYVPVDSRLRDSDWRHPNDTEPRTHDCLAALRERGDDEGQGLDNYWKWGFAAGFNAALAAAPQAPAAPSADERAAYVEFLAGKFPRTYSKEDAEHWWDNDHVSALTWQAARAVAAAPAAPAVDAEPLFAPGTVIGDVVRDTELIVQNDARYRLLRRGQHWSVIDGKGDVLRGDELDSTIDARLAAQAAAKGAA